MRFLFYSSDGMGLGHVRRHLAIASALAEMSPKVKVLMATSVDEVCRLGLPPNVDTLKLPGLRKVANDRYNSRRLGLPTDEIRALRSDLLHQTVLSFRPSVVLVDKNPFGASGEFSMALRAVRSSGGRAVLGLRDILDDSATVRREWPGESVQERIADHYDLVLIYGSPHTFDPIEQYQLVRALRERMTYCGYVVNQSEWGWTAEGAPLLLEREPGRPPIVLGTTGGGEDGFTLLKTFVHASAGAPWEAIAIAGPMLSQQELSTLQRLASDSGVRLHTFIPCLSNLFSKVDGLVCMGGYNTLVEALSQGVPTVCVPRSAPRSEQLLRAQLFERLGLLRCIHPEQLTADKLRHELTAVLEMSRAQIRQRASAALEFDGARRAAGHLLGLLTSAEQTRKVRFERTVS